jgi:hypothetical protein
MHRTESELGRSQSPFLNGDPSLFLLLLFLAQRSDAAGCELAEAEAEWALCAAPAEPGLRLAGLFRLEASSRRSFASCSRF